MKLGLVAAARITDGAIIEPAPQVDGVELVAVAARSKDRATEAAERWNVPQAFGSYKELVACDDIDAVYIATPAALHRQWTLAALDAGKHVLCEKPFASNAVEASEMTAAGEQAFANRGLIVMEAYHWRYHPLVELMRGVLDSGDLGDLTHVSAHFNLPEGAIPQTDIRWDLAIGGGAMMDLGCYPAQWVRWAVGDEPRVTSASADTPVDQIDGRLTAQLAWDSGVTGEIECSMIGPDPQPKIDLVVSGTNGTMTVINPLAPQHGASLEVTTGDTTVSHDVPTSTTYYHQLVAFRDAVATGTMPVTSGEDSVATMRLIDACYTAAGLEPRPSRDPLAQT